MAAAPDAPGGMAAAPGMVATVPGASPNGGASIRRRERHGGRVVATQPGGTGIAGRCVRRKGADPAPAESRVRGTPLGQDDGFRADRSDLGQQLLLP